MINTVYQLIMYTQQLAVETMHVVFLRTYIMRSIYYNIISQELRRSNIQ